MYGIITDLRESQLKGWMTFKKSTTPPILRLCIDNIKVEARAEYHPRSDVASDTNEGMGFTLNSPLLHPGQINRITLTAATEDQQYTFKTTESLQIAADLVNATNLNSILSNIYPNTLDAFRSFPEKNLQSRTKIKKERLAIVTYANGSGGWFRAFYSHYNKMVGGDAIYIATPRPIEFNGLTLGGTYRIPGAYDDFARSIFMNGLTKALRAYYEWVALVDVDEFLYAPHQFKGSLPDFLSQTEEETLYSFGLDVIHTENEPAIVESLPIQNQRKIGLINTALWKPHLSRCDVFYTEGFHFCNKYKGLSLENMPISLHCKWADINIRNEVTAMASNTSYTDPNIKQYSQKEFDRININTKTKQLSTTSIASDKVKAFVDDVSSKYRYLPEAGAFIAPFINASFSIELHRQS